ncbi:MAG: TetR/AcrR family transcriptional regulator [Clostridia bacterium]|nr:TetR/AcrR family transcriptional regulator [Clostridia bacterium]MDE7215229.1 TetR/AcrR family transcriptional regulator [Clostridia bacterium]
MPPKAKFSRERIIEAAISIAERDGIDALTARSLGSELGSSARPIFTVFESMDEVSKAALDYANSLYGEYVEQGLSENIAFKGVGKAYIRFASEHPRLFQLLFMKERYERNDTTNVLQGIEKHYEQIITSICDGYGLDRKSAIDIYFHLWVYSHGIAVLIATNVCRFTQDQTSEMISQVFVSLLNRLKTESKL